METISFMHIIVCNNRERGKHEQETKTAFSSVAPEWGPHGLWLGLVQGKYCAALPCLIFETKSCSLSELKYKGIHIRRHNTKETTFNAKTISDQIKEPVLQRKVFLINKKINWKFVCILQITSIWHPCHNGFSISRKMTQSIHWRQRKLSRK